MININKKTKKSEEIIEKIFSDLVNETEQEIKDILKNIEKIKSAKS